MESSVSFAPLRLAGFVNFMGRGGAACFSAGGVGRASLLSTHYLIQKGEKMPFGWLQSEQGVCKFGKMALIIDMPTPGPPRLPHGVDFANGAWLSRWVDMSVGRGGAI